MSAKGELVSLKMAKLAKSKGFKWKCDWVFDLDNEFDVGLHRVLRKTYPMVYNNKSEQYAKVYARPTLTLLQRWFREEHNIFVTVVVDCTTEPKFSYEIDQFVGNPKDLTSEEWYWKDRINGYYLERTYDSAFSSGLTKAFGLITKDS
jgi:hypothetical protein